MDNHSERIYSPNEAEYIAYEIKDLEEKYSEHTHRAKEYGQIALRNFGYRNESRMYFNLQHDYMNSAEKTRKLINAEILEAYQRYIVESN